MECGTVQYRRSSYLDKLLGAGEDVGPAGGGGVLGWTVEVDTARPRRLVGGEGEGGEGGGGGRGGAPEGFVSQDELQDTEDHHDEAAEEPDLHSRDGVGGGDGGPGGADDVEHDHGDEELEGEPDEGLGDEEGEPGESDEDGGGEVESEESRSDVPGEEDLHPVHAVIPLVPHEDPPAEVQLPDLRVEGDVPLRSPVIAKPATDFHQFDIVSV